MSESTGCLLRLRENKHAFSPKEQRLANLILDNPAAVADMQLEAFAAACSVSISTVVRFCKSLNFTGFKDLCRTIYSESQVKMSEEYAPEDIRPGDAPIQVMHTICANSIQAIENTMAILEQDQLEAAVDAMCAAHRIDFYGMGASGLAALDAAVKFIRIQKVSFGCSDRHNQILTALSLGRADAAVLISYTGETSDMLSLAKEIRGSGATIISLTRYGKNPLADLADIRLYSSSTETLLRSGAMSSRIAQLCVIDIL
ncbi:putative HTH-type transcriptional regulator [Clostridia bacterium]|nr:putative HTH-type transcriptional regulator [Clostridia bacterium]